MVSGFLQHRSTQTVHATHSKVVLLAGFAERGVEPDSPGFVPRRARAAKVDGFFLRVEFGEGLDEVLWKDVHIVIDVAEPTKDGGGEGRGGEGRGGEGRGGEGRGGEGRGGDGTGGDGRGRGGEGRGEGMGWERRVIQYGLPYITTTFRVRHNQPSSAIINFSKKE